jgi:hypothetical protein
LEAMDRWDTAGLPAQYAAFIAAHGATKSELTAVSCFNNTQWVTAERRQ